MKAKCKNLPSKYKGLSITSAYELFINDAEIPAFKYSQNSQFRLRTNNADARKIFAGILANESIDFSILVAQTKKFYNSKTAMVSGLARYFTSGTWKDVYESYEDKSTDKDNIFWL